MRINVEGQRVNVPDDITDDELGSLLSGMKAPSWWETVKSVPRVTLGATQTSIGGLLQAAGDVAKIQDLSEVGAGIAESGAINVEEATPANMSYWQRAAVGGLSSAAQQAPLIAATVVTGGLAAPLAGAAALAGGSAYAESRKAGSDIPSSLGHAGIDATTEALFELIPFKFIRDAAGGPILKLIVGTIAREVPTEVATTIFQSANARLRDREISGQPMDWKAYGQDILDTIGSTMIAAPLLGGVGALAQRMTPDQEEKPALTPDNRPQAEVPPAQTPPAPEVPLPTIPPTNESVEQADAILFGVDPRTITPEQAQQAKEELKKIDEMAAAPAPEKVAVAWASLAEAPTDKVDISEMGASKKQAANAPNYVNPNAGDRLDRAFSFATDQEAVGKTPRQILPQKGTYVLGQPTEDRSETYLKAMFETVEQWRKRFLPDSTIVLSNEQLFTDSALGWHYSTTPGFHTIVPAVLRNPSQGLGKFNANAQASSFYNVTHEFGHALTMDRLFEGVNPLVAAQAWQEAKMGLVSDGVLAQLPEKTRAVVEEYNAVKRRIMDGTMSAQEFVDQWLGPAKAGRKTFLKDLGVAPTDSAQAVGNAIARRGKQNSNITKEMKGKALEQRLLQDFFSLEEYTAEQVARYAYAKKWHTNTPLGKLFLEKLQELRNVLAQFFTHLKKTGGIRPGTSFQEWMDDLARGDRPLTTKARVVKAKEKGPKVVPKAEPIVQPKPAAKAKPKIKRAAHNVASDTTVEKDAQARALVANLVRNGDIEAGNPDFKAMLKHVKAQEWDEFLDIFAKYSTKRVKFELDQIEEPQDRRILDQMHAALGILNPLTEAKALDFHVLEDAIKEWTEKGFRSKYFKAFFGDWEFESHKTSQVVKPISGEPLILYHWTDGGQDTGRAERHSFTEFAKGDLGFHFGTVRAAHVRGSYGATKDMSLEQMHTIVAAEKRERAYIIPTVLNLRNPLDIGIEQPSMWGWPPTNMTTHLYAGGFISSEEMLLANLEIEELRAQLEREGIHPADVLLYQYDLSEPIRRVLIRKGYDGIRYENRVEGGTTYVAFYPEQVKSLLGHGTFSRSRQMHLETDFDAATPEGEGGGKMLNSLRNFMDDPGPFRRAMRRMSDFSHTVLQIQQLAQLNPALDNLVSFNKFNTDYNLRKGHLQAPADHNSQRWSTLGKENQAKLSKVFLEEMEGGQNWFELVEGTKDIQGRVLPWYRLEMNARSVTELQKRGIDISTEQGQELAALILDVKNDLLSRLNEKEIVLWRLLAQRYAGNVEALNRAALALRQHIMELRKYPFFPQGRFGNHMLFVERKKADGSGWDVVYKEAFESKTKRDKAWKEADSRKRPDERVQARELSDTTYVLMALPTDFLEMAATELDLSPEQVEQLQEIMQPVKTEKALKVYDQARLGIKGYTADALRSYANFAWHDSNMVAKMEYRSKFNLAISGMRSKLREASLSSPPDPQYFWRLTQVTKTMEKARDYIMSPPNELQSLRAFVSVTYLGLNVKTALLNLYGLVTTWSAVTSEMGMVPGTIHMTKAMIQALQSLKLTDFNARREGKYLSPILQKALDRALEEGVLSQSYAYHLANLANQGNLNRLIPGHNLPSRMGKRAIDIAMWPFRLTELSARRATFLAMYELELSKQKAGSITDVYGEAVRKTNLLQNDYSLGNRVPFMRGGAGNLGPIAPLATVFMSFAQHMAFHSYGGYELGERRAATLRGETPRSIMGGYTMKIWIVTLLLAGYEGLPGAENIIDLLEGLWRKFGGAKPMRQEMREFVQALDLPMIDPQAAAHGLGHNLAGYDISRSVGFGRFVPGTDVFAHPRSGTEEQVGTLTLDLLGAAGSFIKFGVDTTFNNKPLAENLKRLPGGIGNLYVAYRWSEEGVRGPSGGLITHDLDTGKLRDLTASEIVGKALGFNPAIVSENRAILFEQYDRKMYWQSRRQRLLDDAWRAWWQQDREAQADVRTAVADFNTSIPNEFSDIRIRPIDLSNSRQVHRRMQRAEEQQGTPQRRFRSLYRDIKDSFGPE